MKIGDRTAFCNRALLTLAVVLTQASTLPAQTPAPPPVPARFSVTSEDLLAGGEQILTDGTFIQATRFGTSAADVTAFGITWAKWPGTPAAQYPESGASGYEMPTIPPDIKGAQFTGGGADLLKWIRGPNYGRISGTFSNLKPGARYRAQFVVEEDHPTRDLIIAVGGTSSGNMYGYSHPQVVTFEWIANKAGEPWTINGANGSAVGVALFQRPDLVKLPMNADVTSLAVIPAPKACKLAGGNMALTDKSRIVAGKPELMPLAKILATEIEQQVGLKLEPSDKSASAGDIELAIDSALKDEAYALEVGKKATVKARNAAAVAQGSVTLLQSLSMRQGGIVLPKGSIQDAPAVGYRGLMIDCGRNWHSIATLKQLVVLCRWYKVRYLQLHLSDDESFTFPSTAYPQLATKDRHYTLEELRDLEAFAHDRGVTIVPEVDVPGHATAIVKAAQPIFGGGGNVIGAGREDTYKALDTLTGELCDVFRSTPYFHIGGDEVSKGYWNDAEAGAYMKAHNIDDAEELYRHFIVRMNEIVKKHNKKMIVWEGFGPKGKIEIPKDVTVMAYEVQYYQPDALVSNGYSIVNASWTPLYVVNGNCRGLEEIFDWNLFQFKHCNAKPADKGVNIPPTPQVLGAQMCAWEQGELLEVPSLRHRLAAMSERIWNPDAKRTFADFKERLRATDVGLTAVLP